MISMPKSGTNLKLGDSFKPSQSGRLKQMMFLSNSETDCQPPPTSQKSTIKSLQDELASEGLAGQLNENEDFAGQMLMLNQFKRSEEQPQDEKLVKMIQELKNADEDDIPLAEDDRDDLDRDEEDFD